MTAASRKTALIVGASAGVGKALAAEYAARGYDLFLLASDARDLAPIKADLELRHAISVAVQAVDIAHLDAPSVVAAFSKTYAALDCLALIAGFSHPSLDCGPLDETLARQLHDTNFTGPFSLINAFLPLLEKQGHGNIIVVSSVAAGRARRKNLVYATAKRALEFYTAGIRHYLAGKGDFAFQVYRLGYIDTYMNYGQSRPFPKCSPEKAARIMADNTGRNRPCVYLPFWWMGIILLLQFMPWPLYRKINI